MIVKAADILDEAADSVETNMSMKQIRALIKQQLKDHSDWQIYSMAADGRPEEILLLCSKSVSVCNRAERRYGRRDRTDHQQSRGRRDHQRF
mgnify:CR=1 FL=1